MKILRAEKFKPKKRNKSQGTKSEKTLRKTDWEVLVQADSSSGKLNLKSTAALKDPGSLKRLLEVGMIEPDGQLTAKGRQKCDGLVQELMKPGAESAAMPESPKAEQAGESEDKRIDKLTASDWAVLMKYDCKTGNLLTYDPVTNEMDQTSRAILKDPEIIQRLIGNNMILPGGWLTPEAKQECGRIAEKLKTQPADGYTEQKDSVRDDSESNDEAEVKAEPESNEFSSDRPEVAADQVFQTYDIRQHYPDPKKKHQSKSEPNPIDSAGQMPKARIEDMKLDEQELQNFFMTLPSNMPDAKLNVKMEDLSKDEQRPGIYESQGPRLAKGPTQQSIEIPKMLNVESASTGEMRHIGIKSLTKFENNREQKPVRRRRGADNTGGGMEPPKFSLRDFFHVIFKRKLEVSLFFIAVFLTVAIGTYLTKPTYKATAQLLVKIGRESIFIPATGNTKPVVSYDLEERINSEIEIIKSRELAEKVVSSLGPTVIYESSKDKNPGILDRLFTDKDDQKSPDEVASLISEKAVASLQKNLQVEAIKKSNVIQINFTHQNAAMAAKVINTLADVYFDRHLEIHKAPKSVKFFQEQSQFLKDKLEKSEKELKDLKKQYQITSLQEEQSLLLGQTANLGTELNRTESQIVETEKRIRQLRKQFATTPKTIAQGEEIDRNQQLIGTLETRLVELELEEKELLAKYTDQSRLVMNIKDEIRVLKEKLKEQENKSFGKKRSGSNPTYQKLQEELYRNEAELDALKAKSKTQKTQLVEYQVKLEKLNQIDTKLNQLEQNVDVNRQNYRLYLSKFEESRISDAMDAEKISSVSLIQPARLPRNPVSPNVKLNLLFAIFLGALGGIGIAFVLELLDDKIEKIEDVEKNLQLPVLASIPTFEKKATGLWSHN